MADLSGREIIKRCVHFKDPPRFGLRFDRFGIDDTVVAFEFFIKDEIGRDPWGTTFVVHDDIPSIGMPTGNPVKSAADLGSVRPPDVQTFAARTLESVRRLTPDQQTKYRLIAGSSGIWERPQYLRGMEQLFDDMISDPTLAHRLIEICTDFWVSYLQALAPARGEIDALYMFDDWGTQQDSMVSPSMWREFFAKPYRRITDAAHALGMDFWLHSCGRVTNLIGNFIDVGMDLVNPYQSGRCGYEEVAQRYAGRIAFLTTVDTQSTLPHGTPAQVLSECRRLEKWATPHGGLIASSYGYDIPEANERVVFDYFRNREL